MHLTDPDIAEAINIKRACLNFLYIIETYNSILARINKYLIDKPNTNYSELLYEVIEKFRNLVKIRNIKSARSAINYSVFSTGEAST